MEGAFNDVALDLAPGASEAEVIRQLDGLLGAIRRTRRAMARADQLSHQFISEEIEATAQHRHDRARSFFWRLPRSCSTSCSTGSSTRSASRSAHSRLSATAGSTSACITRSSVLLIAGVGAIAGCAAGAWLGKGMTALYAEFYKFPSFRDSDRSPRGHAGLCGERGRGGPRRGRRRAACRESAARRRDAARAARGLPPDDHRAYGLAAVFFADDPDDSATSRAASVQVADRLARHRAGRRHACRRQFLEGLRRLPDGLSVRHRGAAATSR